MRKLNSIVVFAILTLSAGVAHAQLSLPYPWVSQDVGNPGIAGSASRSNTGDEESVWSVNGSGSDIWGTADSFFFVYRPIQDGMIAVNPPTVENTNPHAKAGIMIRQTTDPGSITVILDVQPDGSIEFMARTSTNGSMQFIKSMPPTTGGWSLQLSRSHRFVSGAACTFDGFCQAMGDVPFPDGFAFAGLAVTSHDNSVLNHATFKGEPNVKTVPYPWQSVDTGAGQLGHPGASYFQNDTFTVTGYGADIWGTADAYQFVQTVLHGDGRVIARVNSEDGQNTFAKAGIVAVYGTKTVIVDVRPNGAIEFMARSTDGGSMTYLGGATTTFPVTLSLQRVGDSFSAMYITLGQPWKVIGTTQVHMSTTISVGLAVTSHDVDNPNTAVFDQVSVETAPFIDHDIGDVGAAGSSFFDSVQGTYSMRGSGADIWGLEDAFNFDYTSSVENSEFTAEVLWLDNTDTFAKAGVMVRASTDPASANVILDVRPNGAVEFMARASAGAATQWISSVQTAFPVTLKLERLGTRVTGWVSTDTGLTWKNVGTVNVALPPTALMGLAVTSHVRGQLALAKFKNVSEE